MLKLCGMQLPDIAIKRLIATLLSTRDRADSRIAFRLHYALEGGFPTLDLEASLRDRLLAVLEQADGLLAELRGALANDLARRRRVK